MVASFFIEHFSTFAFYNVQYMQPKSRVQRLINTGKRLAFLALLCLNSLIVKAQLPENNWIIPSQKYLKLTVSEDGIYQVSGQELKTAGWELGDINPENLQLFYRGTELGIHVNVKNELNFGSEDRILFYGKKNDGSRDSLLYRNSERANPYHSLYSDESAYFLTLGTKAGKRISVLTSKELNTPDEPFHLAEDLIIFDEQFSFNNIIGLVPLLQQSYFEVGEGRSGRYIVSDSTAKFTIPFKNRVVLPNYQPVIEYRINGRSRVQHQLVSTFARIDSTYFQVTPFGFSTQRKSLQENLITNETANFSLVSSKKEDLDWYSMTFIKTVYPQRFLMNNEKLKYFNLVNNSAKAKAIRIADLLTNSLVWNISDENNPLWIVPSVTERYTVEETNAAIKLFAVESTKVVNKISPVRFRNLKEASVNYLIITHESLLASAKTYADYRASVAGGNFHPLITTTEELYNTFNFGEPSPIALRQFAAYVVKNHAPKHLLLLGRGVSFPDELRKKTYPSLVPTIGYPGSDALISAGLGTYPEDIQAIPTGRLNVTKNEEVLNYLEKVKTTESKLTPEIWQKNLLHLSGGQNENEISNLSAILNNIEPTAKLSLLGGKIDSRRKRTNQEIEPIDISKEVNDGLGMITFVGHGSANEIDLNIGYCSPPQNGFENEGKYPIMFFNGCGVGNVFYRYNALSTDWLLAPKKGAIAVFANSFWSYAYPTEQYLNVLYEKLFNDPSTVHLTIGEVQQAAHLQLITKSPDEYIKANVHQMILQGDPALRIFPIEKPEYKVTNESIFISSVNESQVISKNDSLRVGVIIQNAGRYEKNSAVPVKLITTYQDGSSTVLTSTFKSIAYQDTVFLKIKNDPGLQKIDVEVNSERNLTEYDFENNRGKLEFEDWEAIGKLTSFPDNVLPDNLPPVVTVTIEEKLLEDNDFVASSPTFLIELTDNQLLDSSYNYHLNILLKVCETCNFNTITLPQNQNTSSFSTNLKAYVPLTNLQPEIYSLRIDAKDNVGNRLSQPYEIRFRVAAEKLPTEIIAYPNPTRDFVQVSYTIIDSKVPAKAEVFVYNNRGQVIYSDEDKPSIGKNSFYINTKNLPAGRFFVKIIIDEATITSTSFVVK